jgi:hypothetical protein
MDRPRFPTALPLVWNLPYRRNHDFTGRDGELAGLAAALQLHRQQQSRETSWRVRRRLIGKLVSHRETGPLGSISSSGREVSYPLAVAEVFKGEIGQRVEVHSAAAGASGSSVLRFQKGGAQR